MTVNLCNDIIETYNSKIKEKILNIYTPINLDNLKLFDHIIILNRKLEELENLRIEFNKAIDNQDKLKNNLIALNKQIASAK